MSLHYGIVLACSLLAACTRPAVVPTPVTRSEPAKASPTAPSSITGVWIGYADEVDRRSDSDRVQVVITGVGPDRQITGTIAFGEAGTIAPRRPSDLTDTDGDDGGMEIPVTRFSYTLSGTYDASMSRLEAAFAPTEVWSDWCAQQTSYQRGEGRYACLPDCLATRDGSGCRLVDCEARPGAVECGHRFLCGRGHVCDCDAERCTHYAKRPITIDLHLERDELQGPIDRMGKLFLRRR